LKILKKERTTMEETVWCGICSSGMEVRYKDCGRDRAIQAFRCRNNS